MTTRGRPSTLPEPWRTLAARVGGVGNLAECFGVDPRVVRYWAHDEKGMHGPSKKIFESLLREHGIDSEGKT